MRLKNKNHERFCQEYVKNGRNGTQSYQIVYKVKREEIARKSASRLLTNVDIKKRIDELLEELNEKTLEVTAERIIKEYARIAFLDLRKFYNDDGTLKKITELDDDTAAAIAGMDISTFTKDNGEIVISEVVKKIKNVDKKGALDSLAKIKGMFVEKVEVEVKKLLLDI